MLAADRRLQQHARAQVSAEKAPPKHTVAAAAAARSRQERAQDGVMAQMSEQGQRGAPPPADAAGYQEEHTCHLYGVDEVT
jgi:hypothetical protein